MSCGWLWVALILETELLGLIVLARHLKKKIEHG